MSEIDIKLLKQHIENNNVRKIQCATAPISLYNVTKKAYYENKWDDVTKLCRGLVLTDNIYNIVARPFKKFFNFDDPLATIPSSTRYNVYEKVDGACILLFWYQNSWYVTTKSCFDSRFVDTATRILKARGFDFKDPHILDNIYTYIFELVCPESKIIVDYNNKTDLILTGVLHTQIGYELDDKNLLIKRYPKLFTSENVLLPLLGINLDTVNQGSLKQLEQQDLSNKEGYVISWPYAKERIKIKFPNYNIKHKLKYHCTNLQIWKAASSADFKTYPDLDFVRHTEYFSKVMAAIVEFQNKYTELEVCYKKKFKELLAENTNNYTEPFCRKTFSLQVKSLNNHSIYYRMLDNKEYSEYIWKELMPTKVETLIF